MPHRPLFVLRCHHFSPVIYFIAISVSLPPSPSPSPPSPPSLPFLLLHLRSPFPSPPPLPLPPWSLVPSFSRTLLIHPAAHRTYKHLARNSPLHNATQFHSPHPPGDFIIRFCLRLVLYSFPFSVEARAAASRFLFRSRYRAPAAFRRRC